MDSSPLFVSWFILNWTLPPLNVILRMCELYWTTSVFEGVGKE